MRKNLKALIEERKKFIGLFERYGTKSGWHGFPIKTILLKDISDDKCIVADHIWFTMTKGFEALGELKQGDKIEFCARVKEYYKGYAGYREDVQIEKPIELDYKLSHPTKIKKITSNP